MAAEYWKAYGGWKALGNSPYLHVSVVIGGICCWRLGSAWVQLAIDIIPTMMGFSLAGYAIMIASGEEGFRQMLSGTTPSDKAPSTFMVVNATFFHFVFLQFSVIIFALISKALECGAWPVYSAFGWILLVYSLSTALSVGFAIFMFSHFYDLYVTKTRQDLLAAENNGCLLYTSDAADE